MDVRFEYDRSVLRLVAVLEELLMNPHSQEARDRARAAIQFFWLDRKRLQEVSDESLCSGSHHS